MARMHSRRKGKSGSNKPAKKTVPVWLAYKPKDIELLVAKLAKEGKSLSQTGLVLRDTYGIPSAKIACGKSIKDILKSKNLALELPEDLNSLIKKLAAVRKHAENNKKDQTAKRGIMLTESLIKRLVKYYKRTGVLAQDWRLDMTRLGYFSK